MTPNNAINADSKMRRSFVAPLFTAGYGERWASKNLGDFAPELILANACAPDLFVVQTTKEAHHE